ncbi:MAG: EFR1 family ferrodoxin [Desulfobacterales bacterium]|jgi:ferredoxin
MRTRGFIVYCSPAGTTRQVARQIEQTLAGLGAEVNTMDLGLSGRRDTFMAMIASMDKGDCLFVGAPVYRDVAAPPVMDFIEALPEVSARAAIPFVTWGAVTTGVALWQMGHGLQKKGFVLAGAASVVAEHCMMWRSEIASGAGRPDSDDFQQVDGFTREIFERLRSGALKPVDLAHLDYQPKRHATEMRQKIGQPWMIVPKSVDEEKCSACGVCVEQCPVGAVALNPYPAFADNCFDCFNCVRLCPEDAIDTPLSAEKIEAHIAMLKEKYREEVLTRVFLNQ